MACDGILIKFKDHQICIPVIRVIIKWPPPPPNGDPWPRVFEDIRILATINEGIANISNRSIRDNLIQAVQGAAKALSLPDGVQLGDGLFKTHSTTAD